MELIANIYAEIWNREAYEKELGKRSESLFLEYKSHIVIDTAAELKKYEFEIKTNVDFKSQIIVIFKKQRHCELLHVIDVSREKKGLPSLEYIETIVNNYFGVTRQEVRAKHDNGKTCRSRKYVIPRHVFYYFTNKHKYSLNNAGDNFKQDHATVLNAIKTVKNLIETDSSFAKQIQEIDAII